MHRKTYCLIAKYSMLKELDDLITLWSMLKDKMNWNALYE